MSRKTKTRDRERFLSRWERWSEAPLIVLGFVWLVLLILEFVGRLGPRLEWLGRFVWIVFVIDFTFRFALSTRRLRFLSHNWLTAVSLVIPALRLLRTVRALRVIGLLRTSRGLRLVRLFTSLNRGMSALAAALGRRGFGYVAGLTLLITLGGAAGMYAIEGSQDKGGGFESYGHALWWTAMLVTTMGSELWPKTTEGRVLCLFLAVYAFAVFGYVTATLATFFVERDAGDARSNVLGARDVEALRKEITTLREEIQKLTGKVEPPSH